VLAVRDRVRRERVGGDSDGGGRRDGDSGGDRSGDRRYDDSEQRPVWARRPYFVPPPPPQCPCGTGVPQIAGE